MTKARFSIRTAVAEGFEFWRDNWRKAVAPLAGAAGTYALYAVLITARPTVGALALLAYFVTSLIARAALYRVAMAGQGDGDPAANGPGGLQWKRLETNFLGATLLKLLLFLVALVVVAFLMSVLLAGMFTSPPGPATPQTFEAILALLSPTGRLVFGLAMIAALIGFLALWSRLSLVEPATVAAGKVQVFSSLRTSRGQTTAIIALRLLIQAPVVLLQLAGIQLGVMVGDPAIGAVAQIVVGMMGIVFMVAIEVGALAYVHRILTQLDGSAA